jgi:hypothetical protein
MGSGSGEGGRVIETCPEKWVFWDTHTTSSMQLLDYFYPQNIFFIYCISESSSQKDTYFKTAL